MTPRYTVRPIRAHEWRDSRALRLAALSDEVASIAFTTSYAEASVRPDDLWQEQARGSSVDAGSDAVARQFVAVTEDGRGVGTVVALLEAGGEADVGGALVEERGGYIAAVYLAPEHRGRGLLTDLLTAATDWLREHALLRVRLFVHEDNVRAQRAYEKVGFRASGSRITTVAGTELEMAMPL